MLLKIVKKQKISKKGLFLNINSANIVKVFFTVKQLSLGGEQFGHKVLSD
jgi:hypothetical protein